MVLYFASLVTALVAATIISAEEIRTEDLIHVCKSKSVLSRFDGELNECFEYFSGVQPQNLAIQRQLVEVLSRLEEIESFLDDEEKTLLTEERPRSKRDIGRILEFIGIGSGERPGVGQLLGDIIGGDDSDNNLLGIVRRAKRSIREIIANIVNLIFGTVGSAANAIVDAFGLDALLGSDGERSSSSSRRSY